MGPKRKAANITKSAAAPISAFAATQARSQATYHDTTSEDESGSEDDLSDQDDPLFLREGNPSGDVYYNSGSDGEGSSLPTTDLAKFPKNVELSTWKPTKDNVYRGSKSTLVFHLTVGKSITLIGQYDLWVKTGVVRVYGATLIGGPRSLHRIFAPATHALPQIVGLAPKSEIEIMQGDRTISSLGRISPLYRRLWDHGKKPAAGIELELPLSFPGVAFLSESAEDGLKRLLQPLQVSDSLKASLRKIADPKSDQPSKIMVCGPKGAGKSTFGRMLLNHMLSCANVRDDLPEESKPFTEMVCWLDLDPGQPEFSPPGQVSLIYIRKPVFGPPFTHPRAEQSTSIRPYRAHSIAAISPKDDPVHYLACAEELVDRYHKILKNFPKCPLIVNCPGWVLGIALELLIQLLRRTKMTDLVYMSETGNPEVIEILKTSAGAATFTRIPTTFHVYPSRTAAEFREMQYVSYFHQEEPVRGQLTWSANTFLDTPPLKLKYGRRNPDFLGIMTLGEHVTDEFLSMVIDGCILALVAVEDDQYASGLYSEIIRTKNEGLPYWPPNKMGMSTPPDPAKTHVLGLVLLLRIEVETQELIVRTPLAPEIIAREVRARFKAGHPKIMLVRGRYETPGWCYKEELFRSVGRKGKGKKVEVVDGGEGELEDLSIGETGLDAAGEGKGGEVEEEVDFPWVRQLKPGEGTEKKWKARRDFGKKGQKGRKRRN